MIEDIKKLKRRFVSNYINWSFDAAVRYFPVVKFINSIYSNNSCSILEVGSGDIGVSPYTSRKIIGLDKYYHSSHVSNIKVLKGTVEKIPFKKDSFDVVICMDTMEHLNKSKREKATREMYRVTKKYLVIGFPTGKSAQKQDEFLATLTKQKFGESDFFIKEHIHNKLPSIEEVLSALNGKRSRLIKIDNNFPVFLRYPMLLLLFSKSRFAIRFYFLLNIVARDFSKLNLYPSYRKILYIEKL